MHAFGFLSFGHYGHGGGPGDPDAGQALRDAVEIGVGADQIGVNGAYFRVHHFARQGAAPMPVLSAIAARTRHIEVGTGVIDMRYETPLQLAEEAAALDLISDGRVALGVSRGSPEPALRGWEAFGHTGSTDPRGSDIAHEHFATFMSAIRGDQLVDADPSMGPAGRLRLEPHSPGLDRRIWWGAGSRETAEWTARQGVNLMSSTLLTEATGASFGELQAEQIELYRAAWREAEHDWSPRVSVSRSIFPIVSDLDRHFFGLQGQGSSDQVGVIDGLRSTFGKTYAAEPDVLVEQLRADPAIASADTVMLTIPSQLGVDYNLHILDSFAQHVAPELGWRRNSEGRVAPFDVSTTN
ncbi:LLM class flavin-dependent oxidoreductase [Janibacter terrae]|uniref:LLM class flavin-dependent oxidoreductase n=1 Tax=Janibacter terrae TaxID=103817 RepID=UPI00382A8F63